MNKPRYLTKYRFKLDTMAMAMVMIYEGWKDM